MTEDAGYHMTPDEFRRHAHELVEWIARYWERVESLPVLSRVEPGDIRRRLPSSPPVEGENFAAIMRDVDEIIMPGITHWQHPDFFAFFPSNSSGPSVLGEMLAAGLAVQGMSWATSPACTELETHLMDWLVEMLGLPEKFLSRTEGGGVIQHTASDSTLCSILAARERATAFRSNEEGVGGKLVAYASEHAHSSVAKATMIAGIGRDNLRLVNGDDSFAMEPGALASAVEADRAAGLVPFYMCATVGSTSSNAMDPVREIGEIAGSQGLWLHVDAAMSGTASVCPEFRHFQDGLEFADSYTFNPHKWMFTNFDCNAFWVADRETLIRTLSILPEYLRNRATDSGTVFDYRDWHVQLGRRFRALKLWFVLRHYGVEGLRHHVREHVAWAQSFAQWIRDDDDFELAVEPPLNLVCFRHRNGDEFNRRLLDALNASGRMYLTHTRLGERYVLRFSVGQTHTRERHVEGAWRRIRETARELENG